MEAAAILAIIDGATVILQTVMPELNKALQKGTVTPEQQQERVDKLNALRLDAAFQGPEWEKSPTA